MVLDGVPERVSLVGAEGVPDGVPRGGSPAGLVNEKHGKWFLQAFSLVALSDALVIIVVSAIGLGPTLYNAVANDSARLCGNLIACFCALWLVVLFVFDAAQNPRLLQLVLALVTLGLVLASTVLQGISYPWASTVVLIAIPPFLVGFHRFKHKVKHSDNHLKAEYYYKISGVAFFAFGLGALLAWVFWHAVDDKY